MAAEPGNPKSFLFLLLWYSASFNNIKSGTELGKGKSEGAKHQEFDVPDKRLLWIKDTEICAHTKARDQWDAELSSKLGIWKTWILKILSDYNFVSGLEKKTDWKNSFSIKT